MGKKSRSGGVNILYHISESLETVFGLKYLNSLMRIRIRDLGWKKFGSGINIPESQHYWINVLFSFFMDNFLPSFS